MLHSRQPLKFELLNLQRPSLNDLVMTPGVFKVSGIVDQVIYIGIDLSEWVLSQVKMN